MYLSFLLTSVGVLVLVLKYGSLCTCTYVNLCFPYHIDIKPVPDDVKPDDFKMFHSARRDQQGRESNWEKVRQEVTCSICLELLDDPKSMPCLHTYCKKCLMEALAKRPSDPDLPRDRPAINCPLCRAEVGLSDQGIEALPTNFSAIRLVETVQLQDKLGQNVAPKCDGCKENTAIASCCECGGVFLCPICHKAHQNLSITKNHHYVLLNEFTKSPNPASVSNKSPLCQKHPQELLKLYCQDCELLVCRDCVLVTHKTHNYNFVDDIAEKERKWLNDVTLCEIEQTLTSVSQAIGEVQQMQKKVQAKNNESITRLDKTFEDIAAIMENRKQILLQKIHQITEEDLAPLKNQEKELMTLKNKLENCRDFTQDTLNNGTNSEIMSAKKQMLARTKQLNELHKSLPQSPVRKPTTAEYYRLDKIKEDINKVGVIVDCVHSSVQSVKEDGKKAIATVVVKDISGQCLPDALDFIEVQAVPKCSVKSTVDSSEKGVYIVSLDSEQSGDHCITITIAGESISSSSFNHQFVHEKVIQEATNYNHSAISQMSSEDEFDVLNYHNHSNDGDVDDATYYGYISQRGGLQRHIHHNYRAQQPDKFYNKKPIKIKKRRKIGFH